MRKTIALILMIVLTLGLLPIGASAVCSHPTWGPIYSEAAHPHAYFHQCKTCLYIQYTGGYATKVHGTGAWGSGTCPSCGSHSFVGTTCITGGTCCCGATVPPLGHQRSSVEFCDETHPHQCYNPCTRCSTNYKYYITGKYVTKNHGDGSWGSGTCPSCGTHTYVGQTCGEEGVCSCDATIAPTGNHTTSQYNYPTQHPHTATATCSVCSQTYTHEHEDVYSGCAICTPDEIYYNEDDLAFVFKWGISGYGYNACVRINGDNLDPGPGTDETYAEQVYMTASAKWNNISPELFFVSTSFTGADVLAYTPSTTLWNSFWNSFEDPDDYFGITEGYGIVGGEETPIFGPQVNIEDAVGSSPSMPINIVKAIIYISPRNDYDDPNNPIIKDPNDPEVERQEQCNRALMILLHEMGHTIGLGHPLDNPNSPNPYITCIMQQGCIAVYVEPQEKDKVSARIKYGYHSEN